MPIGEIALSRGEPAGPTSGRDVLVDELASSASQWMDFGHGLLGLGAGCRPRAVRSFFAFLDGAWACDVGVASRARHAVKSPALRAGSGKIPIANRVPAIQAIRSPAATARSTTAATLRHS